METGAYEYRENAPEEEKKRWKERYEKLSEPVERRQKCIPDPKGSQTVRHAVLPFL